MPVPTFGGG